MIKHHIQLKGLNSVELCFTVEHRKFAHLLTSSNMPIYCTLIG